MLHVRGPWELEGVEKGKRNSLLLDVNDSLGCFHSFLHSYLLIFLRGSKVCGTECLRTSDHALSIDIWKRSSRGLHNL